MEQHQKNVKEFMLAAGQECPDKPTIPSPEDRVLRTRLLIEEVLETARDLGVTITLNREIISSADSFEYSASNEVDLVGVSDGISDIAYVNAGLANCIGVDMEEIDKVVHESNMAKFGEGGYRDENGKWRKPPNWQAPDIKSIIEKQSK